MKILTLILLGSAAVVAQTEQPAAQTEQPAAPVATRVVNPIINVTVSPLAPPDLDSPYASPRDAARHWLQATLAGLREQHDIRAAMRGFAQSYLVDRT